MLSDRKSKIKRLTILRIMILFINRDVELSFPEF